MWRQESGFLEIFLAYYSQFEENILTKKSYTDFLFDIISAHEQSITWVLLFQIWFYYMSICSIVTAFQHIVIQLPGKLENRMKKSQHRQVQ